MKSSLLNYAKSYVRKLKRTPTSSTETARKVLYLSEALLIGGHPMRYELMLTSAGVLDNVKNERDTLFEGEQVHEKIKVILSALVAELNQTEASNGTIEGL